MMRFNLDREIEAAMAYLQSVCPVDTSNMKNTMTAVKTSRKRGRIRIGGAKAPYAVYTNEKWIANRWNRKKNPNEKWIDKAVIAIVSGITARYRGKVTSAGDIDRWDNRRYHERMSRR